jgi:hypothetical protein
MAIHSRQNLYRGINAHLHSYLQNMQGTWRSFHSEHVIDLRKAIGRALPPGYIALSEQSLQIEVNPSQPRPLTVIPDVLIASSANVTPQPVPAGGAVPLAMPLLATMPELDEEGLSAVAIYKSDSSGELGRPCTVVELLSPANKPPQANYEYYRRKRIELLRSGLRLVEIDYLHETRSPIAGLASYVDRQPNAYPYTILVSDPRPTLQEAQALLYGFHVDEPIPVVPIPLEGTDVVTLDFGAVYNTTYTDRELHESLIDYEQLPIRFDIYSADDQARIRARMQAIKEGQPTT